MDELRMNSLKSNPNSKKEEFKKIIRKKNVILTTLFK